MPVQGDRIHLGRLFTVAPLKGLFHPACLARVVSWNAFVVAIFMAHENGDKQRPAERRHVQGMLDETDPLTSGCISKGGKIKLMK